MLNVNNNRGVQNAAGGEDASKVRVKSAVEQLQAAKARGPLTASGVAAVLRDLQPGDVSAHTACVIMTRVQARSWGPSDFSNESIDIDTKAGANFSALARALRALVHNRPLPEAGAAEVRAEDRMAEAPVSPRPVIAETPRPVSPRPVSPRPVSPRPPANIVEVDRYAMDPETAALIALLEKQDALALTDRQAAIKEQEEMDKLRNGEDSDFKSAQHGYVEDGLMSAEELAQQAALLAQFARPRN